MSKSKLLLFLLLLLRGPAVFSQENTQPKADPRAVITEGHARFTILTPRLVRMEWRSTGAFVDIDWLKTELKQKLTP
jgi:hypothetical protein